MKAADFLYHRAQSLDEAVQMLADYDGEARILAGGQSLIPMMNMRLWRPAALIDINAVQGLDQIQVDGESVRVGALVRYETLEHSPVIAQHLPLLAEMVPYIGDRQVRNRGTLGGSLVQGDPTAEVPLACMVLGAQIAVRGPEGRREIPAEEFYDGSYAAAISFDEVLEEVIFPRRTGQHAFIELTRRHGDFCVLSVAAIGQRDAAGRWSGLRLGLGGVHDTAILASEAAAVLEGGELTDAQIEQAASLALLATDPPSDMRASAQYRKHLIPVYVRRALQKLRASAE